MSPYRLPAHTRVLLATTTAALTLVGSGLLLTTPSASAQTVGTGVAHQNPPALWMSTSASPTDTQLQFAADHYRVAVFNAWDAGAMQKLHALNPAVKVLVYKDLSSTRSYSGAYSNGTDAALLPTGVGYGEATATNPAWFARDVQGQPVQWGPYPAHWQMAVWDASYQQRWVDNVVREVTAAGWDGVLADNALSSLKYYTSATLADGRTDVDVRAGISALVAKAGQALQAKGRALVPNISDGRLTAGRWNELSSYGGGLEEQFLHWGTDPTTGYVGDWASGGWSAVTAEMATPGLTLARTSAGPSDVRPYRYGLASFYVAGGGKGAFTAVAPDAYSGTPLRTEQTWDLGAPISTATKVGTAWTRTFAAGFVAANPSETTATSVAVPPGMQDADGRSGTVLVPPLSGLVARSTPTATNVVSSPSPTSGPSPTTSPSPTSSPSVKTRLRTGGGKGPAVRRFSFGAARR